MDNKKIIKGFKQGYTIQKHHPELAKKLLKGIEGQKSDLVMGFTKGVEERQKEMSLNKHREIKMNYQLNERDLPKIEKNKDRERNKD